MLRQLPWCHSNVPDALPAPARPPDGTSVTLTFPIEPNLWLCTVSLTLINRSRISHVSWTACTDIQTPPLLPPGLSLSLSLSLSVSLSLSLSLSPPPPPPLHPALCLGALPHAPPAVWPVVNVTSCSAPLGSQPPRTRGQAWPRPSWSSNFTSRPSLPLFSDLFLHRLPPTINRFITF